jgi:hypothetical protein
MNSFTLVVLVAGFLCGCATAKSPTQSKPAEKKAVRLEQKPIQPSASTDSSKVSQKPKVGEPKPDPLVTPDYSLGGKVATFNSAGRFVVLDFPAGKIPALEQTMFVYRDGLKVGEVKITGPTRDNNTVADLISGGANKGDEVRDR